MKVIIDTNILISAILKNRIPEEVVFSIIINHAFQWLTSLEIIDEYKPGRVGEMSRQCAYKVAKNPTRHFAHHERGTGGNKWWAKRR